MNYEEIEQSVIPEIKSLFNTDKVDYREISTTFSRTQEAIDLVNRINPGFLSNIAYIFNEKDSGVYGVFNSSVDYTVKILIVKDILKKNGFQTLIDDNKLYAYKDGMQKEEVDKEIKKEMEKIDSMGGVVIGINIQNILYSTDSMTYLSEEDKDKMKIIQLASVIAHEAVHAKGEHGEAVPEKVQEFVVDEGIKYYGLNVSKTANNQDINNWYKKAQMAPFTGIHAIEPILRNHYLQYSLFSPVEKEKNDSIEAIISKNYHSDNTEVKSIQELLERDYDNSSNGTLEKCIDMKRTRPLILPILKEFNSNNFIKISSYTSNLGGRGIGGLFGYMNGMEQEWHNPFLANEINDNINRDEAVGLKYWRRRYDPMYARGSYKKDKFGRSSFNWDIQVNLSNLEHRNLPQKWKDRDPYWPNRPDIAVASEDKGVFIIKDDNYKNSIISILKDVGYYKNKIKSGKRKGIRLIVNDDAFFYIEGALSDIDYVVLPFKEGKKIVWLYQPSFKNDILKIEDYIRNNKNEQEVSNFVNLEESIKGNINKILSKCKVLCKQYGMFKTYIVGGFCRTLASTRDMLEINDLDFSSSDNEEALKLGGLLAADLGIDEIGLLHRTMTMSYEYNGIKMDFKGGFVPADIRPLLRQEGLKTTQLNFDIYSRDFTINGLIYSFIDNKIYDITGRSLTDLKNQELHTFFDPDIIVPLNPLLITRGIILNLKGFSITEDLDRAFRVHSQSIFNGNLSNERLTYEYEKISKYGEDGLFLLKEYGIQNLKSIRDKVVLENPDFFN